MACVTVEILLTYIKVSKQTSVGEVRIKTGGLPGL